MARRLPRDRGDDRGHRGRARRRARPARQRRHLAELPPPGLVVREPRRHLVLRALGDRHRPLGPEGQAARRPGHPAPRRRPPRAAARDREHASERARASRSEADRHARYVNELGFRGCKLGLGKRGEARLGSEVERDVELMRLLRERIGPEPLLMWDRGVNTLTWDAAFAIRLTNALEEHGLTWIEEPFEPDDLDDFRRLQGALLDARRLRRAGVERRGIPELHRGGRRGRDRLRPGTGGGDHGRPAGDRARRGGRRLVQRARLVERDRLGGKPRALADDPARARVRAQGRGEPDAARARGERRSASRAASSRHSRAPASASRSARRSSSATGSEPGSSRARGNDSRERLPIRLAPR